MAKMKCVEEDFRCQLGVINQILIVLSCFYGTFYEEMPHKHGAHISFVMYHQEKFLRRINNEQ